MRGYRGSAQVTTDARARSTSPATAATRSTRAPAAGDIALDAVCAPPRLSLRSGSGSIRAVLPAGRYDIDAESTLRRGERARDRRARDDAPYSVQVLSASGDVVVEGRS